MDETVAVADENGDLQVVSETLTVADADGNVDIFEAIADDES